jgi:hypothetical protein
MVRVIFGILVSVHAAIHAMGFAKAFGVASLDALRVDISRPMGTLWLAAGALLAATVAALMFWRRWFWLIALLAAAVSQVAILSAWREAAWGSLANGVVVLGALYGAFAWGPFGLRAVYERSAADIRRRAAARASGARIGEADLAALPADVQRYLRLVGVLGAHRSQGFYARMRGRIRGSATQAWMDFEAEQINAYDPPRRLFFMTARRGGVPLDGLHVYDDSGASMRVRLLSALPVVNLSGVDFTATETVTLLNDMSIFAPWALLDPALSWRELHDHTVEVTYTNAGNTVRGVLCFDPLGQLVNFWSHDRQALAEDGKTLERRRWATPLSDYTAMGPYRLATRGEARYGERETEYSYLELEILEVSAV